ncbi:hypothetical protein EU514_23175 [Pseudomonas fragi]|nr:hypothetical protein [Pseudomonas fragi]
MLDAVVYGIHYSRDAGIIPGKQVHAPYSQQKAYQPPVKESPRIDFQALATRSSLRADRHNLDITDMDNIAVDALIVTGPGHIPNLAGPVLAVKALETQQSKPRVQLEFV